MKGFKHWFGEPVPPGSNFRVRGIGVQERMPPKMVNRPQGTGDYLLMFFHGPVSIQGSGGIRSFPPGHFVMWRPGAAHHYGRPEAAWLHSWMHCEGPFVDQKVKVSGIRLDEVVSLGDPVTIERPLLAIHEELTSQAAPDPVMLENLFENLLRSLQRRAYTPVTESPIPDRFLKIRAHLESHYTERIGLESLAGMAHLSVAHFCSEFKRHFGVPAMEFVIRLRMHEALHQMRNCNHSVTEVAALVGYDDLFYFSKLFKKRWGMSPRAMRAGLTAGGGSTGCREGQAGGQRNGRGKRGLR